MTSLFYKKLFNIHNMNIKPNLFKKNNITNKGLNSMPCTSANDITSERKTLKIYLSPVTMQKIDSILHKMPISYLEKESNNRGKFIGSGIAIRFDESVYVMTAAHVADAVSFMCPDYSGIVFFNIVFFGDDETEYITRSIELLANKNFNIMTAASKGCDTALGKLGSIQDLSRYGIKYFDYKNVGIGKVPNGNCPVFSYGIRGTLHGPTLKAYKTTVKIISKKKADSKIKKTCIWWLIPPGGFLFISLVRSIIKLSISQKFRKEYNNYVATMVYLISVIFGFVNLYASGILHPENTNVIFAKPMKIMTNKGATLMLTNPGDSGAPIFYNNQPCGVVSFGIGMVSTEVLGFSMINWRWCHKIAMVLKNKEPKKEIIIDAI